jgi:hypothetical protein
MCEGSTPTLPFCDAQGSENPAPPFITDVRSSSREAASQSSRSNFRAVTESLAVPFLSAPMNAENAIKSR